MKKIIAAAFAALLLCGCSTDIPVQTDTQTETAAETQETLPEYSLSELWDYRIKDGYAEICRYLDPPRTDSELIIPETLEGYPVIFRDSKAFAGTECPGRNVVNAVRNNYAFKACAAVKGIRVDFCDTGR